MTRYKNLSGNSGVSAYEIGEDYLAVEFTSGSVYLYNYESNGKEVIEGMKILAEAGKGLSTFISQYIKNDFAQRLR